MSDPTHTICIDVQELGKTGACEVFLRIESSEAGRAQDMISLEVFDTVAEGVQYAAENAVATITAPTEEAWLAAAARSPRPGPSP